MTRRKKNGDNGHIRVEVGEDWALIQNTRTMNFGQVRKLRRTATSDDEDGMMAVAASLIAEWEAHDTKTGELLGPPSLETIDRTAPAFGLALVKAVGDGLSGAIPLALTKESGPS
jgi:hypothetical protein